MHKSSEVIHARIEPTLKHAAEGVFKTLGLTMTEAIRLFFTQVELHNGLPFDLKIPNAASRKAIREARAGNLRSHNDFSALRKKLKV